MWTRILWTVLLLGFSLHHPYVAATATESPNTSESGKTSAITTITTSPSTQASVTSDASTVQKQLPTSTPQITTQTTQAAINTTPSLGQGRIEETTQLKTQEPPATQQQTSTATPSPADSKSSLNTTPTPSSSAKYTPQPASTVSVSIKTSAESFAETTTKPISENPTPTTKSSNSLTSVLALNTATTTATTTKTAAAAAAAATTTTAKTTTLISNAANSSKKSEQISTTTSTLEMKQTDTSLQTKVPAPQVSTRATVEGTTTAQSLTSAPVSTVRHITTAKEAAPERIEVHTDGRKNEAIKNTTDYELLVKVCKKVSVLMLNHENGSCFLGVTRDNGTLKFTSVSVAVNLSYVEKIYSDMIKNETPTNSNHSDDDEIPKTLIAILASCGALVLILFAFAVYCTYHRRSYRKNQQHLTEELQTVENGYHDNPTLEVMEVQPEMQEKKLPLNGEFSDSWIVPFDNLAKDDLPDEEDTHL